MVSRKKVQAHILTKTYLKAFDLDVFTEDGVLRIVGRGIDKVFATDRAAKIWATKLDNAEQCRRANAIALG